MLDNYKGSPDVAFSRDIHTIAENSSAIAHSLALIAGILAKREGIPCTDPSLLQKQPTPSARTYFKPPEPTERLKAALGSLFEDDKVPQNQEQEPEEDVF